MHQAKSPRARCQALSGMFVFVQFVQALAVALVIVLALAGCDNGPLGPRIHIDFANTLSYHGVTYTPPPQYGRTLTASDLGPVIFTVAYSDQAAQATPEPTVTNGSAGILPKGTPVYTVVGYAATFRVAVNSGGRIVLYEAETSLNAHTGADLLDIAGKVHDIRVIGPSNGTSVLAVISQPQDVQAFVGDVLAAQVKPISAQSGATTYDLVFDLRDGTAVERPFYEDTGVLGLVIHLPPAFGNAISTSVSEQRGTPYPTAGTTP